MKYNRNPYDEPSFYVAFMMCALDRRTTDVPSTKLIRLTDREWRWAQSRKWRKRKQAYRSALRRRGPTPS